MWYPPWGGLPDPWGLPRSPSSGLFSALPFVFSLVLRHCIAHNLNYTFRKKKKKRLRNVHFRMMETVLSLVLRFQASFWLVVDVSNVLKKLVFKNNV